jgi:hypothetical protein
MLSIIFEIRKEGEDPGEEFDTDICDRFLNKWALFPVLRYQPTNKPTMARV